jgi:hypothetical protein
VKFDKCRRSVGVEERPPHSLPWRRRRASLNHAVETKSARVMNQMRRAVYRQVRQPPVGGSVHKSSIGMGVFETSDYPREDRRS